MVLSTRDQAARNEIGLACGIRWKLVVVNVTVEGPLDDEVLEALVDADATDELENSTEKITCLPDNADVDRL